MLASLMQYIFDKECIANEYLRRAKAGAWKKENAGEALKCWNLECAIEADAFGKLAPKELTLKKFTEDEA